MQNGSFMLFDAENTWLLEIQQTGMPKMMLSRRTVDSANQTGG